MNSFTLVLLGLLVAFATAQNCVKTTQVTQAGLACDATNVCTGELFCDTTTKKCKFAPLEGNACSADTDCTNVYYNLFCSSGKCTRRYKNQGESCVAGTECASLTCTGGACTVLTAGQNCTSGFCGSPSNALFCNGAGVCQATVAAGQACGITDTTKPTIYAQCQPGLFCVNTAATQATVTGTCTAPTSTEGAACSATQSGAVWSNTYCNARSGMSCIANKCTKTNTVGVGAACTAAGTVCDNANSVCTNGTCTAYGSLSCPGSSCGIGTCNCPDSTKPGTCAAPQAVGCLGSQGAATDCFFSANTQNGVNLCGDKLKAIRCCARTVAQGPLNADLTLAYCSSATQASFAFVALIAMIVMLL